MRNLRVASVADRVPPPPRPVDRLDRLRDLIASAPIVILSIALAVPLLVATAAAKAGPVLAATATTVSPGASITITASGLPARVEGALAWDDTAATLASFTTDARGRARIAIVIPATDGGSHRILAVDASATIQASLAITVAPPRASATVAATRTPAPATASPVTIVAGPTPKPTTVANPTATPTASSAPTAPAAVAAVPTSDPTVAPASPSPTSSVAPSAIPAGTATVCGSRLPITASGTSLLLPYCTNRSLSSGDASIRRAVIVVHGDSRNAPDHFRYIERAAATAGAADVLIIAPQFMTAADVTGGNLPASTLYWSDSGWKQGDGSGTAPLGRPWSISSFAVMDRLLTVLSDSTRFPNLREIVVVGHSAGGQFSDRYAATTRVVPDLAALGTQLRFVVANPSSYLYLDGRRFQDGVLAPLSGDQVASCSKANSYKYGLERLNSYAAATGVDAIRSGFGKRTITYLLGDLDTSRADASLDTSCAGDLQGTQRLDRGTRFFAYLGTYYGTAIEDRQVLRNVAGVGHDASGMYGSATGRAALFGAP